MPKRTKIVCTIGPASQSVQVLKKMIAYGMNAARLNFSHGAYSEHRTLIKNVRTAAALCGKVVTIIQDLQGPRVRLGEIKGKVFWRKGENIFLDGGIKINKGNIFPVTYKNIHKDIKAGSIVLVEDGKKELKVLKALGRRLMCKVIIGGEVSSHKGLNFPGSRLSISSLTSKDKEDVKFGVSQGVDYIVMSFVSSASSIRALKNLIKKYKSTAGVIAKIELKEALKNIKSIISEADGIMIGRGDLALQIDFAKVPIWQKKIVALCREQGKPVIVATQMLESLMKGLRPTRPEVSDVSNAVFDNADAVMLSGESAQGEHPVEAVRVMSHIILEAEDSQFDDVSLESFAKKDLGVVARLAAEATNAQAILVNGDVEANVVRLISRVRPELPIIYKTKDKSLLRKLNLYWGVEGDIAMRIPSRLVRVTKDSVHSKKMMK